MEVGGQGQVIVEAAAPPCQRSAAGNVEGGSCQLVVGSERLASQPALLRCFGGSQQAVAVMHPKRQRLGPCRMPSPCAYELGVPCWAPLDSLGPSHVAVSAPVRFSQAQISRIKYKTRNSEGDRSCLKVKYASKTTSKLVKRQSEKGFFKHYFHDSLLRFVPLCIKRDKNR